MSSRAVVSENPEVSAAAPDAAAAARRIIFIYAAFAAGWILVSDTVMGWFFSDPVALNRVSLGKGWMFVAVTTLLLYGLIRRMQAQMQVVAERELAAQKESANIRQLLDNIVENSSDAIFAKDESGRYLLFNQQAARFLGTTPGQVIGNDDRVFFPDQYEMLRANDVKVMAEDRTITYEETLPTAQGEVTFLATKGPLRAHDGKVFGMFGISRDITARKQAEELLRQSVKDKQALLREVHHRVKNNLQVIISLLRLEAGRSTLPDTRAVLASMQGRIRTMALLHDSLYRTGTFASVDMGTYLGQLAGQTFKAQAADGDRVELRLDLGSVMVGMDQAISAGLLVNELITNSLKHGFPDGRSGVVSVALQPAPAASAATETPLATHMWRLCLSDDGVGLPADFEHRRQKSLGQQLVSDLTQQIGGTLTVHSQPGAGAEFAIDFRVVEPAPLVMPQ